MEDFLIPARHHERVHLDVVPLIDVVFVLLIFTIMASSMTRETGVKVEKPQARSAQELNRQSILVGVTREGTLHVHGRQVSPERLRGLVTEETAGKPDLAVVIVSDQDASVKQALLAMDMCVQGGATKVSIAADKQ